jgi:hypothetical protein
MTSYELDGKKKKKKKKKEEKKQGSKQYVAHFYPTPAIKQETIKRRQKEPRKTTKKLSVRNDSFIPAGSP